VVFAAILLSVAGGLNLIYGIAAITDASFFVDNTRYVFSTLSTWGWILVLLGSVQMIASISLLAGNAFGRVIGIFSATLGAIGALLAVGGAYPFWSLGVFALCVIVIHGLVVYEPEDSRI
jgi:hypothetical protein